MTKLTQSTTHITTPDIAKAPDISKQMSRKQFNGYLHKLYGCSGNNDVKAHYIFGDDDYFIEVFLNSPAGGTMIAVHHDPMQNSVDVLTYSETNEGQLAA